MVDGQLRADEEDERSRGTFIAEFRGRVCMSDLGA